VLTDSDQLKLHDLPFDVFGICLQPAFLHCSFRHDLGEHLEVEVGDVSLVSLKVGIVSEELIELIASRLPLQQNVFAVRFELLFHFDCDSIG
jgi:hypothetical protein